MPALAFPVRDGSEPAPLDHSSFAGDTPAELAPTIRVGDHVFERSVIDSRTRFPVPEVKAVYRRRIVTDVDLAPDGMSLTIGFQERFPTDESMVATLHSIDPEWHTYPPAGMPDFPRSDVELGAKPDWEVTHWEPERVTPPPLEDVTDLIVHRVQGRGSRQLVNHLLIGEPDGRIDHRLGGVAKWKAGFIATHDGHPYSVAVLAQPYSYSYDGASEELYVTRLANHPNRPPNTSSWMLARLRDWMRKHTERKRLVAIAGIDNNVGTCYQAAGFELDRIETVSSTGWESREGRAVARRDEWTERRYVLSL
ncbi:hypothetical protein ACERIT_07445 [Halopenitus sp. H-Gu1]|uniref:hypothetical protein n=1 Tax=Halopenitus sp. H-Gu1 TaxID=3242697 RepID=UPI00359D00A0